jgi:CRP/FNR family transcriptional regulator, cyclic AMP receptor protein
MPDERLAFLRLVAQIGGSVPLPELDGLGVLSAPASSFIGDLADAGMIEHDAGADAFRATPAGHLSLSLAEAARGDPRGRTMAPVRYPDRARGKRFFEFMSHDERVDCLVVGNLLKHPSGTVLVRRGDRPNGLRVLLHGEAEVRRGSKILAKIEVGDVIGEISFVLMMAASADVVASTEISVLDISEDAIERLLSYRPSVTIALYRSLAAELARRLIKLSDRFSALDESRP